MILSIIIPVYNCASYLEIGFEHLKPLYSSNLDFEIIFVNDGSTDNSLQILKEIERKNQCIKIISQENQGSSGARNTAIDVAKGDYLQFLDSDDLLDVEKLLSMLSFAQESNLELLGYRMDYVDESYNNIGIRAKHPISYNKIMSGYECLIEGYQPSSICVFLFRRSLLIENKLRIYPRITHMDVEFMTRVMLCAKKVVFKEVIAYHYLQRLGSITKPTTKTKLEKLNFDEVIIAKLIRNNIKTYNLKDTKLIETIKANSNSVVWNLLKEFVFSPRKLDKVFKKKCIDQLKLDNLYPIQGPLKTKFQVISKLPFQIWLKLTL
jgi:glycosyltransferase involved in cell wall biosynthesis